MIPKKAFAIVRTAPIRKTMRVSDSRLPIYWLEEVALDNCPRNHEVIEVTITQSKVEEP
jgi:hypothetical protein